MAAAWMNDPRWNLDLTSTVTSTLKETAAASASAAISKATSKSTPPTIPLSTIVFRPGGYEMGDGADRLPLAFNPLILRVREAVNAFFARMTSGSAGAYLDLVVRGAKTLTWVVAVVVTGFIAVEVGWALHKSYVVARTTKDPTNGPVIPIDPLDPIGFPAPPVDSPPPPAYNSTGSSRRDIRVKLFSEILTGYLTLILSVSVFLGDSVILQFLLSGLTGFVAMVAVMLPDEAEWSRRLYNYNEGGFEMRSILVQPGDEAYNPQDVKNATANEDVVEIGTCMRGGIRTGRMGELADKTEEKLKEVREKVAERIQDATAATRKVKAAFIQKPDIATTTPQITITRDIEEEDSLFAPANEDLKAQLSRVMAPVKDILDTDRTMEKASKKVEAWLMKAGDSFCVDSDIEDERDVGKGKGPVKERRPSFIAGEGKDSKDTQNDATLRLRS
ncbi:hypothetical protein ABW21_db0203914 [Orbilia brochopaga]|nr:hypothetical protein ABW21_db0203914 [Drechslerella brochopaga]